METWREIVAEMREVSGDDTVKEIVMTKSDWLTLADRIEATCKALEEKIEANQELLKRSLAYSDKQDEEIAKLRRALEPVMNVDLSDETTYTEKEILLAVREAQAIMKGGEK